MNEDDTHAAGDDGEQADAEQPSAARPSRLPQLLALLLLGAIGVGYYWVEYRHADTHRTGSARLAALEAANLDLGARLVTSESRFAELAGAADPHVAEIAALRATLDGLQQSLKGLYAKESQTSLDWVLAEVEYLVLAASQRLALEHDVTSAVAALKAADARLRAVRHPELLALREQLAADIAALEGVKQPDIEGLALYLAEAVTRVDKLPTKPIADLDMSFSRMGRETAASQDWRGMARALWADIRSLVEIKDGKLEDGVLFDPELRYFLQQNLRLELSSARLAVLQGDNANFRAALTLIVDLLGKYYDTGNGQVSALVTRLNEQRTLDLRPHIPSLAAGLDAVRAKREQVRDASAAQPRS